MKYRLGGAQPDDVTTVAALDIVFFLVYNTDSASFNKIS